jgi:vitamin B12 transporter
MAKHGSGFSTTQWPLLVLCVCSVQSLFAENENTSLNLPDLTVNATYRSYPTFPETTPANPVNTTIDFPHRELEQSYQRNPNELLRGSPGIGVIEANEGRGSLVQIRGVGANQGMVTFDGVPLLTTIPALTVFDSIPVEGLESINIIQGTDHVFYPYQSVGGAIHFHTKVATENYLQAHLEGGSFGTLRETLSGGMHTDKGSISVTGSRNDLFEGVYFGEPTTGLRERDPTHNTMAIAHYEVEPSTRFSLEGSVFYKSLFLEADLPTTSPQGLLDFIEDPNTFLKEELWLTQHTANLAVSDTWNSRLQLAATGNHVDASAAGLTLGFDGDLQLVNWRNTHRLTALKQRSGDWWLDWGGEIRHERGKGQSFLSPLTNEDQRNTQAGFVEIALDTGPWHYEAGMRVENYDDFGTRTPLHLGSRWQVLPELVLHANIGTGFRAPSLGELLTPILGNQLLPPERGMNGDVGIEWSPSDETNIAIAGYYGRYDDLTVVEIIPAAFYGLRSIPEARIYGVESSAQYTWSPAWHAGVDLTLQETGNLTLNNDLPFSANVSGLVWGQWDPDFMPVALRVTTSFRTSHWNNIANTLQTDGITRLSALLTYRITPDFDIYLRGENLTDDQTQDAFAHFSPGAAVYSGVHIHF